MKLYPKSLKSLAFGILRVAGAIYLIILLLLFFGQERLIFFPTQLESGHKFNFKLQPEEKTLVIDGSRVHSLYFGSATSKGLILFFHGNAGNLSDWGGIGEELVEKTGLSVWMVDYPGYGLSEGKIGSEKQLHLIAAGLLEAAKSKTGSLGRIVVYGRSIGTGLAVKLASENKVGALILESPYFSLINIAQERFPWAPLFLLKYEFHSDRWMPQVDCPALIVHGVQDEVIPFEQGRKLSSLAREINFVPIAEGHHNDLSDFPEYWNALTQFLSGLKLE